MKLKVLFLLFFLFLGSSAFEPLILQVKRTWRLFDDKPLNTEVTTVSSLSQDSRHIQDVTYSIRKADFNKDYSKYFSIDNEGVVRLKRQLESGEGSLKIVASRPNQPDVSSDIRVVVGQRRQPAPTSTARTTTSTRTTTVSTTSTSTVTSSEASSVSDSTTTEATSDELSSSLSSQSVSSTAASPPTLNTPTVSTTSKSYNSTNLTTKRPHLGANNTSLIILVLTVSIILIIAIVVLTYKRLTRQRIITTKEMPKPSKIRADSNKYEDAPTGKAKEASDSPWGVPRHKLKFISILGEGCFGQVWKCELEHVTVAVKTLKDSATDRERKDLLSELEVMKTLDSHPNVVKLIGCCIEEDPPFVIMEYVALGKLQQYLRDSRASHDYNNLHSDSFLTSKDLTRFGYQIAKGMDFLAANGIIHRDLAARNILLDENRTCKVADFGFAKINADLVYERKSDHGLLPVRWMSPESLFDNIHTAKSDVWSFGILLWEIITLGSTPYPGQTPKQVMESVKTGYRLEKPEHCRREFYNIMFYCWNAEPERRPTFKELVTLLSELLENDCDYVQMDLFPEHDYYNFNGCVGSQDCVIDFEEKV